MSDAGTCSCGKSTRDQAYVCDDCTRALSLVLADVALLEAELETTIAGAKGVDYRTFGGMASEAPSPVAWGPSRARGRLHAELVSWTLFCRAEQVRNQSPTQDLPADTLTSMATWLAWRVDGLSLLDVGPDAVEQITSAVNRCRRLIDRPADREYLGPCRACEHGRLYVGAGEAFARCSRCNAPAEARMVRAGLIADLEDRLCTAAEIARLSTYLGLAANRDQVRNRINQWRARGRVHPSASSIGEPTYRFGTVYDLLVSDDGKAAS